MRDLGAGQGQAGWSEPQDDRQTCKLGDARLGRGAVLGALELHVQAALAHVLEGGVAEQLLRHARQAGRLPLPGLLERHKLHHAGALVLSGGLLDRHMRCCMLGLRSSWLSDTAGLRGCAF